MDVVCKEQCLSGTACAQAFGWAAPTEARGLQGLPGAMAARILPMAAALSFTGSRSECIARQAKSLRRSRAGRSVLLAGIFRRLVVRPSIFRAVSVVACACHSGRQGQACRSGDELANTVTCIQTIASRGSLEVSSFPCDFLNVSTTLSRLPLAPSICGQKISEDRRRAESGTPLWP